MLGLREVFVYMVHTRVQPITQVTPCFPVICVSVVYSTPLALLPVLLHIMRVPAYYAQFQKSHFLLYKQSPYLMMLFSSVSLILLPPIITLNSDFSLLFFVYYLVRTLYIIDIPFRTLLLISSYPDISNNLLL